VDPVDPDPQHWKRERKSKEAIEASIQVNMIDKLANDS
jgi:hypothetical protein